MITLLSLLAVVQTTSLAQDDLTASVHALRDCMDAAVRELEPSGETAPVVAAAARETCNAERGALLDHAERASSATGRAQVAVAVDDEMRSRAVMQVTRIRADRQR